MKDSFAYLSDRRSLRHAAELVCHVVRERGFVHIAGKTLDISVDGMRVASDADVALGDEVVLSVCLPRGRHWIDAQGRIVRIEVGTRENDDGRAIAIAFTAMDPVDRAMLAGATAAVPPPVPRRLVRRDYAATLRDVAL